MAVHEKAWTEPKTTSHTGWAMPAPDVVVVQVEDDDQFGIYINGTLAYVGTAPVVPLELLLSLLGGETRAIESSAVEEMDGFPPRLLDIEWKATDQSAPVNLDAVRLQR